MTALLSIASGLAAGLLSGVFGIGGGIVLVPLLGLALGLGQHEAQGITLAILVLPLGLAAVLEYHRRGAVRWRLVLPLVGGFLAGVAAGSLAANAIPERPLRIVFAGFIVLAAARTAWSAFGPKPAAPPTEGSPGRTLGHALWIGAVGGLASGLLGIGGAVIMIPLMGPFLRLGQLEAQGTSLATMLPPIGLPGVWIYARAQGGLPWEIMALVAAGFVVGAGLGARIAGRLRGRALTGAFLVFQLVVAALLVARALAA